MRQVKENATPCIFLYQPPKMFHVLEVLITVFVPAGTSRVLNNTEYCVAEMQLKAVVQYLQVDGQR